jgi:competence protein ComEC
VKEALKRHGVDRIALALFTHPDPRHVEGWREVFDHIQPEEIRVGGPDRDHGLYAELPMMASPLCRGDQLEAAGWSVEVLWPPADLEERSSDDRSLVLRFTDGFASVLVMGGASERVVGILTESDDPLAARILLAGHHRSRPSVSREFLRAVRPDAVVVSGLGFHGPTEARQITEARVIGAGVPLLRLPPAAELRLDPRRGTWIP